MLSRLLDLEARAKAALSEEAWSYLCGFAGTGAAYQRSIDAFAAVEFRPRVLRNALDPKTTMFGCPLSMPVITAPMGHQKVFASDGELAIARAASATGIGMALSAVSSYSLEDVARVPGSCRLLQIYCFDDRSLTEEILQRGKAAGYDAICLTVDLPAMGERSGWSGGRVNIDEYFVGNWEGKSELHSTVPITWADIDWIISKTDMPLIVKGVLDPEDAAEAVARGARGVVVSSHGGRQLDFAVPPLFALPDIAAAVGETAFVILDGGVRSGVDVVKALGLGADAVFVGRPLLWALASGGEDAVRLFLTELMDQVRLCLQLVGARNLRDIHVAKPLRG